ncbi:MAG: hypothetical protein ACK4EY_06890 [Flavipsychrobacter sp.]|jgi:hypothetical protein|nr:hypothetical protein [Chitinophagales bacterium]
MRFSQFSAFFIIAATTLLFSCKKNNTTINPTTTTDTTSLSYCASKITQPRNWHYYYMYEQNPINTHPNNVYKSFDTTFALTMRNDSTVLLWQIPGLVVQEAKFIKKDDTSLWYSAHFGAGEDIIYKYNFTNGNAHIGCYTYRASYIRSLNCNTY